MKPRLSPYAAAIALGKALFHDPGLSGDGAMACATCHLPERDFSEGLPRAMGRAELDRNTPSLRNLRAYRWFGWAGQNDNLWAQSMRPIVDAREMHATPEHVVETLRAEPGLLALYREVFGAAPDAGVPVDPGPAVPPGLHPVGWGVGAVEPAEGGPHEPVIAGLLARLFGVSRSDRQ